MTHSQSFDSEGAEMEPSLWETLGQLFVVLGQLIVQLLALGAQWLLLIVWVVWWLRAVNWQKLWPVLGRGAWAPLVLLMVIVALAWSRLQPLPPEYARFSLWLQFGYVTLLVAVALFCGWLQGVLQWVPPEINLEPPAHGHDDGHGHTAHH
jgi:hypothetical protein